MDKILLNCDPYKIFPLLVVSVGYYVLVTGTLVQKTDIKSGVTAVTISAHGL